jgi:hypothetical protein
MFVAPLFVLFIAISLCHVSFTLFMWNKVKSTEYSSQDASMHTQHTFEDSQVTNLLSHSSTYESSDLESKLKEQRYKQLEEIVRIQEDIRSRNLPIKMRREHGKITDYQKIIDKIEQELKDLEKSEGIKRINSTSTRETLIQDKNILEQLIKESKETISNIINADVSYNNSVSREEDAKAFREVWNKR